jgi:hypothetical protein
MRQLVQPSPESSQILQLLLEMLAEQQVQTKQLQELQSRAKSTPPLPSAGEECVFMPAMKAPEV